MYDKFYKAEVKKAEGKSERAKVLKKVFLCLFIALYLIPRAMCLVPSALYHKPNAYSSKPVTVIVSLSPPYTPFLNEYGSAGVNKLQVSLIVNDSRMVNYPAKLQMLIEHVGSGIVVRTSEYAAIAPIMLTGNVTEVFNGFDLNKYFLAQNNVFTGFDQSQYIQTGRVPDGQYRIGFRIVDAQRTEVVLSNTAYTQPGWFVLNDPPQINLPRNKEKVRVNELQNVKLEWFPRHLGSLNAAFATSYQVELFAIRVPGMNPNQAAMSMQPAFTDVTNRTSYNLTNDKYLLEPGVEYAFRIKAMAGDDGLTLFQNNGYSEVFSFIYGSLCPEPENVSGQTLGTDKVEITWDTDPLQTSFETRFRKAGQVNGAWHVRKSFIGMAEIANVLSPGVKYEYQVKATCTTVESDYSALDYFTMPYPPNPKFECGADDNVIVSNTVPKSSLQPGELIFYGQFPIKLTDVSGSNGLFTGKGRMRIPFLANIQVNMQFNGIKVNELNQVYEGELVSIYNPDSKFLIDDITDYFAEGDQIGNIIDGVDSAAITLGFSVDNASNLTVIVSGNSVTVSSGGQSVSTTIENSEEGTTIQDSEGNLYAVDENGNVSQVGKTTPDGETQGTSSGSFSPGNLDSEIQISFENAGKRAFDAFDDVYAGSKFANEFETVNGRITPWKFVPIGKSDKVSAKLTKGSIDLSKIKFKTPTGTEFYAEEKGGKLEITLIGAKQRDGYELFAVYEENDSTTRTIGKVNIASYPLLKRHLTIVPMQSGSIDASSIETATNNIYKPYGISWTVTIDDIFDDRSWDTDHNGLKGTGTEFYSAFTDEMRALNANYTTQRGVDDKSVYLFWFAEDAEGAEYLLGDMPLESRFGYIFSPTITDKTCQTIAHELAHGVFQLRHTFSSKYGIEKNTTNNLMDYAGGTELVKYQWDVLFDAQNILFAWAQDEEEGAARKESTLQTFIEKLRCAHISGTSAAIETDKSWPYLGYWTDDLDIGKEENIKYIELQVSKDGNFGPFDSYTKKDVPKPYINKPFDEDRISLTFTTGAKSLSFIVCKSQEQFVINYLFPKPEIWKQELENQVSSLSTALEQEINDDYEKRIVDILTYLSDCAYEHSNLDGKLRGELINVMSYYLTLKFFGGSIPENEEQIILKLLLTTKDSDVKVLVDKLLETGVSKEQLLKRLDEGFSDIEFLFKDQNYKNFAGIIWELIEKAYPINDKLALYQKLHAENKVFRWTKKINGVYYNSDYSDNGQITISFDEVISSSYADYNGYLTVVENTEKRELPLQTKEYVYIHFEVDIPALEVKKGDICFVPAYVLHHLIEDRVNENTATLIRVGIDVASIAIGVGAIKNGVTGAKLFFEILEIGTALGDIALTGFEDKLNETPEGQRFIKAFNTIAIVGGIANIGQAGITKLNAAMPDEIGTLRNVWKNNPEVKSVVTAENPTVASKIDGLVDELDEYEEWAKHAGDLGGALTNFVAKSGDELEAFLRTISKYDFAEYSGDFYRTVDNGLDPLHTHPIPRGKSHRYSKPGEDALYFSSTQEGNFQELTHWGKEIKETTTTYVYKDITASNLLDLTNANVRKKLGITLEQITGDSYEFSHVLGTWARQNFDGIIAPTARGLEENKYFVNVVVFKSGKANEIVKDCSNIVKISN